MIFLLFSFRGIAIPIYMYISASQKPNEKQRAECHLP